MTLINFLFQQHNYPLPQHINVIGFRHFYECSKSHYNPALFRHNWNKVGQQTSQHFQNDVLKEITKISQLDTF